ncbi:mannose-6-phosphate isomerase, class I [Paenactinomyces guangxiensis]|uniref:Mannose-6-phosphate isomerase n=1 Tax=Paenactinomyces guangxiensis TaxID=1490290 RepID=A0A7W1WRE0_9BACL|nr:mannose-6-phosphate isomerase, class I [Paenactinomyces guangxiensis]MBA4494655.1 mannose-6-phosphate isomerase, class I [Paenactinomyces guangxiensis]MBH8591739.1 mannose-6-phosphate isomerase, class I [Paenactinomyces guangxiensis]
MYQEPIFLQPAFKERIWGGNQLQTRFGFSIPSPHTGECWGISAHPEGLSRVKNGPLQGKTLDEVWKNHRELFANQPGDAFPLLIKILDAQKDLSVQVHPDDKMAMKLEGYPFGKTECWYIIDCDEGAEIILGHHASSKEELKQMIRDEQWDLLLKKVSVKPGDFFYVTSGTIHAIGKGIMILETQQSSDITYRVYDYDRTDANGNKRPLHVEKSIAVTNVPDLESTIHPAVTKTKGLAIKQFVSEKYFTVQEWSINGETDELKRNSGDFLLCSVIDGGGKMVTKDRSVSFTKGDFFILPATIPSFRVQGNSRWIVSHP